MCEAKQYHWQQTGAALLVMLCVTTLCMAVSLHVLSITLGQETSIQREITAFQAQQAQQNQREMAQRTRQQHSLADFLSNTNITLVDWLPDHLGLDCDTGMFLYTVTAETTDKHRTRVPSYYRRRHEAAGAQRLHLEKCQTQHKTPWLDKVWVGELTGNWTKKIWIEKDRRHTTLSAQLAQSPRLYALTGRGEFQIYADREGARLLQQLSLGKQISVAQSLDLPPEAWTGYLLTQTVTEAGAARQLLWIVLQHPACADLFVWTLDISDPLAALAHLNSAAMLVTVVSGHSLPVKPLSMQHPQNHRPGLLWIANTANTPGVQAVQWFQWGTSQPTTWFRDSNIASIERLVAVDRWQTGYPDSVYLFDALGRIWRRQVADDPLDPSLRWSCLSGVPILGRVTQVAVVSRAAGGVDIIQQKQQQNRSLITLVSEEGSPQTQAEKILEAFSGSVVFFVKSPYLWLFEGGSNWVKRFSLGNWHRQKRIVLKASLPNVSSMVTTLFTWSDQENIFLLHGLTGHLLEKTVKIQDKHPCYSKK